MLILVGLVEKIPRSERCVDLQLDRRFLFPPIHQPCGGHSSGVHARRWRPCEISTADTYFGEVFDPVMLPLTCTQIAKMLQNLANKPSYAKEQYMMSLNPFVESNKARMNQFLSVLCEVGDFYESLEVSRRG